MAEHRFRRLPALVAFAAIMTGCGEHAPFALQPASSEPATVVDGARMPKTVRYPAPAFKSLQEAVDAVADDGTVFIGPGVHKVNADVVGKSIRFFGERNATTLVAGDGTRSVLRFGAGGGGEVRDLTIQGGTAAIEGYGKVGLPRALLIRNVLAGSAAAAVAGQFEDLEIRDSRFSSNSATAIRIAAVIRFMLNGTFVTDAGCYGLLVFNTNARAGSITIRNSSFNGNACGGIGIFGGTSPIVIEGVTTHRNGIGGMVLFETSTASVSDFTASASRPDATGRWGDGVVLYGGTTVFSRGFVLNNARAGISIHHCGTGPLADFTMSRTDLAGNRYDLGAVTTCETWGLTLTDDGRNRCLDHPGNRCALSSSDLAPLPPPE